MEYFLCSSQIVYLRSALWRVDKPAAPVGKVILCLLYVILSFITSGVFIWRIILVLNQISFSQVTKVQSQDMVYINTWMARTLVNILATNRHSCFLKLTKYLKILSLRMNISPIPMSYFFYLIWPNRYSIFLQKHLDYPQKLTL